MGLKKDGVMDCWSFEMVGENPTEDYEPFFRAYRDTITCSVKVIEQK